MNGAQFQLNLKRYSYIVNRPLVRNAVDISTKSRGEFRDEFLRLARARISLLLLHTTIQDKQFAIRFSMCPCMYDMNFFSLIFLLA